MKIIIGSTVLMCGMLSFFAQAEEVKIIGRLIATPCSVAPESVSQTIDFGRVKKKTLQENGNAGEWHSFDIKLMNCPSTTLRVVAQFNGTPFSEDPSLYGGVDNTAGIAVQIAQYKDRNLVQGIGSTMVVDVDQATRSAVYALTARLFSPDGEIKAGSVNSAMQISFTYQ